jgi:hypothetical protein
MYDAKHEDILYPCAGKYKHDILKREKYQRSENGEYDRKVTIYC